MPFFSCGFTPRVARQSAVQSGGARRPAPRPDGDAIRDPDRSSPHVIATRRQRRSVERRTGRVNAHMDTHTLDTHTRHTTHAARARWRCAPLEVWSLERSPAARGASRLVAWVSGRRGCGGLLALGWSEAPHALGRLSAKTRKSHVSGSKYIHPRASRVSNPSSRARVQPASSLARDSSSSDASMRRPRDARATPTERRRVRRPSRVVCRGVTSRRGLPSQRHASSGSVMTHMPPPTCAVALRSDSSDAPNALVSSLRLHDERRCSTCPRALCPARWAASWLTNCT